MINGKILRDAFISGANNIANNRQMVDALNVFPVPDGDTGTNMSMTIGSAKRELERISDETGVGEIAKAAASALLRGARGNSGVILSLLFRGFSKGLADKDVCEGKDVADALAKGVKAAYKAVMKPTEGTILTVSRLASEHINEVVEANPEVEVADIWNEMIISAKDALAQTPELLPVLKKAGVVDAGGQGFVVILEGMYSVIKDGVIIESDEAPAEQTVTVKAAEEGVDEINYTYSVAFTVLKADKSVTSLKLRAYAESIGDHIEVSEDSETIKCSLHTDNPGNAIQTAIKYGMLTDVKIENMRQQLSEKQKSAKQAEKAEESTNSEFPYAAVDPERDYGFVAVCAGDGIKQLFLDLGVDCVVSGGQTMNPSTDDILSAIHSIPAKNVIVLPNNKNIIMAAEQTIKLADRNVCVLPTRTIPQGLTAMLSFDASSDLDYNRLEMTKAFEKVGTGLVTFAARDSNFDGHKIKKDEILALENGKVSFVEKDLEKAAVKLTRSLIRKDETKEESFVTIIYGEGVTEEQAVAVQEAVAAKCGDNVEFAVVDGGQPVYYFIISVE